jgi:hypothetical protein
MTHSISEAPKISVLMAVHNGGVYLRPAIESLLVQSFPDFEFVIVDDGSTDGTPDTITQFALEDSRIRAYRNESNAGLIASLNRGLAECRAEIVARADADDLFHVDRLQTQYDYLSRHPDVGVLGSTVEFIDTDGRQIDRRLHDFPINPDQVRLSSLLGCCLWHTTVAFRKSLIDKAGGYRPELRGGPEDYDLWSTLLQHTQIENLPTALAQQRLHSASVTANWERGFDLYCEVARKLQASYLSQPVDNAESKALVSLCGCDGPIQEVGVSAGLELLHRLLKRMTESESHCSAEWFRQKCSRSLVRQAGTMVYENPQMARCLISHALAISPRLLISPAVSGIGIRLLAPHWAIRLMKTVQQYMRSVKAR